MNEFVPRLLDSLVRASWQGGLALGLAWGVCRLAPGMSPRVRCWLWRLVYLKLLVALLWISPVRLPLLPALTEPAAFAAQGDLSGGRPREGAITLQREASPAARPPAGVGLLAVWLFGVGACGLRTAREWAAARRLKRRCEPGRDAWLTECGAELSQRLGLRRRPSLRIAEGSGSPLLLGGLLPTVILPSALCETCTPAELRLMLAHELAHLKRQDLWWCWLPSLAHGLFFFHPLVWVANREWRLAQELACDELALEITAASVGDYGTALLKVAAQSRPFLQPGLAAVGADEFPQTLRRRLMAMKTMRTMRRTTRARMLGVGAGLALAGVIGIIPWRVVAQEPAGQDVKAQKEARARAEEGEVRQRWLALVQELGLTDAQLVQIKATRADFEKRAISIKEHFASSPDAMDALKAQMRALFDATTQRLSEILSPEQLRKLEKVGGIKALLFPDAPRERWTIEDVDRDIAEATHQLELVGLTNAQKARLNQVFAAARNQAAAILANPEISDEQRAASLKMLRSAVDQQIQATLTSNQRQRLLDMQRAERLARFNEDLTKRARKLALVGDQVGLTDTQKARLNQIFVTARNQATALFTNRQLPEEQRAVSMKMLYGTLEQQILAILTPEQQKRLFGENQKPNGKE